MRAIPAIDKYPDPFIITEWRIGPGTEIQKVYINRAGPPGLFEEYWTNVYIVVDDFQQVAAAASLEDALEVLQDRYLDTLPF